MMQGLVTALLWFAAVGCGLIAGVYFTFSAFVLTALTRVPDTAGIAAMQSINRVILRSLFLPLFFATSIVAALLALVAALQWEAPGSRWMLTGGLVYVVAMCLCTVVFNVPLNNVLEGQDPAGAGARKVWVDYVRGWMRWNHVRTIGSTLATAAFIAALVVRASAVD